MNTRKLFALLLAFVLIFAASCDDFLSFEDDDDDKSSSEPTAPTDTTDADDEVPVTEDDDDDKSSSEPTAPTDTTDADDEVPVTLVGTWHEEGWGESDDNLLNTFEFTNLGTFTSTDNFGGNFHGTYSTDNSTLTLNYIGENSHSQDYQYSIDEDGTRLTMTMTIIIGEETDEVVRTYIRQ